MHEKHFQALTSKNPRPPPWIHMKVTQSREEGHDQTNLPQQWLVFSSPYMKITAPFSLGAGLTISSVKQNILSLHRFFFATTRRGASSQVPLLTSGCANSLLGEQSKSLELLKQLRRNLSLSG